MIGNRDARTGNRARQRAWLWWPTGVVAGLILHGLLAFVLHPWPGTLLVRYAFDRAGAATHAALEKHAPQAVESIVEQQYREGDADAYLDAYFPAGASRPGQRLPTVVWIHGGAWLSGHRDDAAPYFQLIAAQRYTVISVGYSLAPTATYPAAVHQINDALGYIARHADRLHSDPDRIMLAGDSAGAQLASQIAALTTNRAYADELRLTPALSAGQLRGVILDCGLYDMQALVNTAAVAPSALLRWGVATMVWAYTGSRTPNSAALRQMSTIHHVTSAFPPTFITGGNADPLTADQSRPMAARLEGLGVDVTTLFYPDDHQPPLKHEYQFNLDTADGQKALAQTLTFLQRQAGS